MKILIVIFITFFSQISFSADKSKNDDWFSEAKKYLQQCWLQYGGYFEKLEKVSAQVDEILDSKGLE